MNRSALIESLPLNLQSAIDQLSHQGFEDWAAKLAVDLYQQFRPGVNGNLPRWLTALSVAPTWKTGRIRLDTDIVQVGGDTLSEPDKEQLKRWLLQFFPWRKGPFSVFGVKVDSEWQSNLKWDRVAQKIAPLAGKRVLDVGCGNGYYAMRMLGAGARWVLGVDTSVLALVQVTALKHFMQKAPSFTYLPISMQAVPRALGAFDTVFSMGVLYHRRDPVDHLKHCLDSLRPGGQLVLETLVIEGSHQDVLVPEGRYAQMNNVWYLPSVPALIDQLAQLGFHDVQCVDVSCTTVDEQRTTEWMPFYSLKNFLHPTTPGLTIEGYPRPVRAIITATR